MGNLLNAEVEAELDRQLYKQLRHFWHPVAHSKRLLNDNPFPVTLLGERLVVARLGEETVVFDDLCRHRGTALSLGWVEDEMLRCAYHGWTYDATGTAVDIPARPELSGRMRVSVPSYPVVEACGLVWVCLDQDPKFPVAKFPERINSNYRTIEIGPYEWATSLSRHLANHFDLSHLIHNSILANRSCPFIHEYKVECRGAEIQFGLDLASAHTDKVTNDKPGRSEPAAERARVAWSRYRIFVPNAVKLTSSSGKGSPGEDCVFFVALAPVAPNLTRAFTLIARNYAHEDDEIFREVHDSFVHRDQPLVESQRPEALRENLWEETHSRGADRGLREYRRRLVDICHAQFEMASFSERTTGLDEAARSQA